MFASQITDTVTIGTTVVTIRKLSWSSLDHAQQARSTRAMATVALMGDAAAALGARAEQNEQKGPVSEAERRTARYQQYDRGAVLQGGLHAWTSDTKLTPKAIEDLDEDTADRLYRAILDLSLPPLDPAEEDVARKNA